MNPYSDISFLAADIFHELPVTVATVIGRIVLSDSRCDGSVPVLGHFIARLPSDPYYVSPSSCGDVYDAMDNAGWYFDRLGDVWGPYDAKSDAAAAAAAARWMEV